MREIRYGIGCNEFKYHANVSALNRRLAYTESIIDSVTVNCSETLLQLATGRLNWNTIASIDNSFDIRTNDSLAFDGNSRQNVASGIINDRFEHRAQEFDREVDAALRDVARSNVCNEHSPDATGKKVVYINISERSNGNSTDPNATVCESNHQPCGSSSLKRTADDSSLNATSNMPYMKKFARYNEHMERHNDSTSDNAKKRDISSIGNSISISIAEQSSSCDNNSSNERTMNTQINRNVSYDSTNENVVDMCNINNDASACDDIQNETDVYNDTERCDVTENLQVRGEIEDILAHSSRENQNDNDDECTRRITDAITSARDGVTGSSEQTIDFFTAFGSQECEANSEICDELLTTLNGVIDNTDINEHELSVSKQYDRANGLSVTPCSFSHEVRPILHHPTVTVRPTARVERVDKQHRSFAYYGSPSTSVNHDIELTFQMVNGGNPNECE